MTVRTFAVLNNNMNKCMYSEDILGAFVKRDVNKSIYWALIYNEKASIEKFKTSYCHIVIPKT